MQAGPDAANRNRMAALDGLRFVAALSVAVFHLFSTATWQPFWGVPSAQVYGPTVFKVASYGWVGVPLFFMISGFVICMSSWGRSVGEFGISRFVRLYPAYWFAVLATTAVAVAYPHPWPALPWRDVLTNLTMFQEPLGVHDVDLVYWTLWVELRFYLLFALIVWRGLTYRRVVAFCFVWVIASVWAAQLGPGLPWLGAVVIDDQSQYFIAGIALFLMYRFGSRLTLWLLLGFSWIMSMHYYIGNTWQQLNQLPYAPSSVLITLFYFVLILLALRKLDWVRWRWLTTLGAITYPLYLLHQVNGLVALSYLNGRVPLQRWALATIVLVAMILVGWLVHRLIERPLAPLLKRALSQHAAPRESTVVPEPPAHAPETVPLLPQPRPGRHATSEAQPDSV
jgi:peptidoglycan/LPS O-acetylase OafA/YrhL